MLCVFWRVESTLNKARAHVDKILTSLPVLISSSSISSYQIIQLVAINLYAILHCRRRLSSAASSVAEAGRADDVGSHQNGEVAVCSEMENSSRPTSSDAHASYDKLVFSFTGSCDILV